MVLIVVCLTIYMYILITTFVNWFSFIILILNLLRCFGYILIRIMIEGCPVYGSTFHIF